MLTTSTVKTIVSSAALVAGCVAGVVASAYGVTLAYVMGATAQADLDQSTPADPRILLRVSFQQLIQKTGIANSAPIHMDEAEVEVNDIHE